MFPSYPHYVFYQFIRQHMPARGPGLVVDAPCGGGYITDLVARDLPSKKVVGADIDPACVEHARKNYHRDNLDFKVQDIHGLLDNCGTIDSYLLINSIFLLPQPDEVMAKIRRSLSDNGKLITVIPNTESANFENFQAINQYQNKLILDKQAATTFLQRAGFRIESIKGLAYTTIYGNRLLGKLGKLRGIYTYAGEYINRLTSKAPSYWGIISTKS